MFVGTIDRLDVSRTVLIETHYFGRLDEKYLSENCFSIVILEQGSMTAKIQNTNCHIQAPAILCLDEQKKVDIISNNSYDVRMIRFDPRFLNVYMDIPTLRSKQYEHLCQQHAFFQLSPFLTDDIEKICIRLSQDTLEKVKILFDQLSRNLKEQSDWYWSCRARSYFIDIINILERIYHNYFINEPYDICVSMDISNEFKCLLSYVNNHLEEKQTLDLLYEKFRINKNQIENLFKEFLNMTFYEYLRKRRFEEASYYLRFTELDGEQIAERIGLSSSQNFCKFFKSMSGMTPNTFRQQMLSKRKNDKRLN